MGDITFGFSLAMVCGMCILLVAIILCTDLAVDEPLEGTKVMTPIYGVKVLLDGHNLEEVTPFRYDTSKFNLSEIIIFPKGNESKTVFLVTTNEPTICSFRETTTPLPENGDINQHYWFTHIPLGVKL